MAEGDKDPTPAVPAADEPSAEPTTDAATPVDPREVPAGERTTVPTATPSEADPTRRSPAVRAEDGDRPGWWRLSRREMLGLGLGGAAAGALGLAVGFLGGRRYERRTRHVPSRDEAFNPSAFLAIATDGTVHVWVTRSEMGQGVATSLPQIVADELEADWRAVRIHQAPASPVYGNQLTVGSASIRTMYGELRQAGAVARAMLVQAAADTWEAPADDCFAADGAVVHRPSGRRLPFGALATRAADVPMPADAPLKASADFRLIGRPTRRLDAPAKVDGTARYGLDVRVAGRLVASIERPPALGADLIDLDDGAAREVEGVVDVLRLPQGIAVVALSTWAAFAGRRALRAEWSQSSHAHLSTDSIEATLLEALDAGPGGAARSDGDAEEALRGAPRTLTATYQFPYLAHATMEPINATARVAGGRCDVWAPTQAPQRVQRVAAEVTGLPVARCHVEVTYLGGGFGRRSELPEVHDALELAKALSPRPVQVVWTREDDVRNDLYRNIAAHRFTVGLDAAGRPLAWKNEIVTPRGGASGEVNRYAVEGAAEVPYDVGPVEVRWAGVDLPFPTGIWRSVGHSYNAFAVESMIDEVAEAAGADPVQFRLERLPGHPRQQAVLRKVAEISGWSDRPTEGPKAYGVAVHGCFGSYCAQVAEVSLQDGRPRVHRVWAAVDCGQPINPLSIEAQVEGGIVWGLTAALRGRISHRAGAVVESNFQDYRLLRFDEMPEVAVSILDADRSPTGMGEVAVPPIAPAVGNALAALTGERRRRLPFEEA